MLVITLREDGTLEAMVRRQHADLHIVVIHEREEWTDSPVVTVATEGEMTEWLADHRNAGYEDRNP